MEKSYNSLNTSLISNDDLDDDLPPLDSDDDDDMPELDELREVYDDDDLLPPPLDSDDDDDDDYLSDGIPLLHDVESDDEYKNELYERKIMKWLVDVKDIFKRTMMKRKYFNISILSLIIINKNDYHKRNCLNMKNEWIYQMKYDDFCNVEYEIINQKSLNDDIDEVMNMKEYIVKDEYEKFQNEAIRLYKKSGVIGINMLISVIRNGDEKYLKYLLDENLVDVNVKDEFDNYCLLYACLDSKGNKTNMVELLIQYGCPIDFNSLIVAKDQSCCKTFQYLINHLFMKRRNENLYQYFQDEQFVDISLFFNGMIEVKAHKSVLRRSVYLREIIDSENDKLKENNFVKGIGMNCIEWLYGRNPVIKNNEICLTYLLARKWELGYLMKYICLKIVRMNIKDIIELILSLSEFGLLKSLLHKSVKDNFTRYYGLDGLSSFDNVERGIIISHCIDFPDKSFINTPKKFLLKIYQSPECLLNSHISDLFNCEDRKISSNFIIKSLKNKEVFLKGEKE